MNVKIVVLLYTLTKHVDGKGFIYVQVKNRTIPRRVANYDKSL